jgi:hypothetical protein
VDGIYAELEDGVDGMDGTQRMEGETAWACAEVGSVSIGGG